MEKRKKNKMDSYDVHVHPNSIPVIR